MKKMHWRKCLCEIFSLLLVFTLASSVCFAYNPYNLGRTGRREIFGQVQLMKGDKTTGLNTQLSIDDFIAFGLGYGFNINEHLNINLDLFFTKTDYSAINFWAPFFIDEDVTIQGYDLNLDINLLKSQITPLMTGGIGSINFSGASGFS